MARSDSRPKQRRHTGRVTLRPCEALDGERYCEPLNRIWVVEASREVARAYAACTCGRRFPLSNESLPRAAMERLEEGHDEPGEARPLKSPEMQAVIDALWPEDRRSDVAKVGVVPVGVEVLHRPTRSIDFGASTEIARLQARMLRTMEDARGIGLAANQIGAPVRMIAHNLPRIAPMVLVNPHVVEASGEWEYVEGCLSLNVEGTRGNVRRPKVLTQVAALVDGAKIVITADELFARVLQHELDHLAGIEYVQRLDPSARKRVYRSMELAGIDVRWVPPIEG